MDTMHKNSIHHKFRDNPNYNVGRVFQIYQTDIDAAAKILSGDAFKIWYILISQQGKVDTRDGFTVWQPYDYLKEWGYKSPATIKKYLDELKEKGFLVEFEPDNTRSYYSWEINETTNGKIDIEEHEWNDEEALKMADAGTSLADIAEYYGYSRNSKSAISRKLEKARQKTQSCEPQEPIQTPTETEEERKARLFGFGGDGW